MDFAIQDEAVKDRHKRDQEEMVREEERGDNGCSDKFISLRVI